MPLFLVAALLMQAQPQDDSIDLTPGICVAAADRLDADVGMARAMLEGGSGKSDRLMTEGRIARAAALASAIRARYPKVAATDDDRDELTGVNALQVAEKCAPPPAAAPNRNG